jgi:hypothetical protein
VDPRETEFWVQSGAKTARNIVAWLASARRLKRAADVLRAQWKTDLLEFYRHTPSGKFPESVGGSMMLLAAFAVENLVKGLLIARDPNAVAALTDNPERLVHGASARHLSVHLCAETGVSLSEQEEDAVRRLEIHLLWAGRYPVPKDARKLGERHRTAEPQLESAASFSEIELDVIDHLFARLAEDLEREAIRLGAQERQGAEEAAIQRRVELLRRLDGVKPRIEGGARVFDLGDDPRDEPAAGVSCAGGCRASFRLTPRTQAAICGCGTLYWAELFYDASLRREQLGVVGHPATPCAQGHGS